MRREVTSSDGLKLAAYEAGNRTGPEIVFIHGFSQCARCWEHQFYDPLLSSRFRLVAFDIRVHGASDKPDAPEYYAEDRLFADDVRAVIDSLGLEHPAWSAGPMPAGSSAIIWKAMERGGSPASTTSARGPTISRNSSGRETITWPA